MIIDLHCHTKNVKEGDANREVDVETFSKTIIEHEVQIVAITNHNIFDLTQFDLLSSSVIGKAMVWPGVELDVTGDKSGKTCRGHVIVICDPDRKEDFSSIIKNICGSSPNTFSISVDDLLEKFLPLNGCLFICHYYKNPELSIEDISFLKQNLSSENLVLLEPSNSRKVGLIVYEDKFACWFGSDVKDWHYYPSSNPDFLLPDCLFNISSFESFKTLLSENNCALLLKTLLSSKAIDEVKIQPFDDLELNVSIYKDINIIFGGKATGKTIILQNFEEYFKKNNKKVHSYYIERKQDDLKKIVQCNLNDEVLKKYEEKSAKKEFSKIKEWSWIEIPTLKDFYKHEVFLEKSETAKRLKITSAKFSEILLETNFDEKKKSIISVIDNIKNFQNVKHKDYLNEQETDTLNKLVDKLLICYKKELSNVLYDYYAKSLEKWSINYLSTKFANENSIPKKPISNGLIDTYTSFKNLENYILLIKHNFEFTVETEKELVGVLPMKGNIYKKVYSGFLKQKNPKKESLDVTGGDRKFVNGNFNTNNISRFSSALSAIDFLKSSEEISFQVKNLITIIDSDKMVSLLDLLNYSIFLQSDTIDDFKPSNGVISILLVDSAVRDSKCDVIVLDEPDGGMGADFVNETLIPELKKRASEDKIILIGTHDANLVVRTHPYCCIYREETCSDIYDTYIGSSFEDYLISINNKENTKLWVDACVDKCEGGIDALRERERAYGRH